MNHPNTSNPTKSSNNPLSARNFRFLWLGEGISVLGDHFYLIALPWLVLQLSNDPLALGTIMALASIPRAIFILVGGAVVDRFSPRTVMFLSNFVRMLLVALMTVLVFTDSIELWMLYGLALIFGVADGFFYPANSAILPQILKPEQLQMGNAFVQGTATVSMFLGPAAAGFIIAAFGGYVGNAQEAVTDMSGIAVTLAIDALSFLASLIALAFIDVQHTRSQNSEQGMLAAMREGLAYVWDSVVLRTLFILLAGIYLLMNGPTAVGFPVLVRANLAGDAAAYGIVVSAQGLGMLLGVILAGVLPRPKPAHFGVVMMLATASIGLEMLILPFTSTTLTMALISLALGTTSGYIMIHFTTWLQRRIPQHLMGRVMSLVMFTSVGAAPVSSAISGAVMSANPIMLFVAAGGLLMALTLFATMLPGMRRMGLDIQEQIQAEVGEGMMADTGVAPVVQS